MWNNKWVNGAIPALLLHINIGSVYCWSLLKDNIAEKLNVPTANIEVAFSLAIFFLGMSAAFGGKLVEKNVSVASFIATFFYTSGLLVAGKAVDIHNPTLFIIGYGVIMGIGLGIGYLSPIKTLMLWFKENKGLAAGIAIAGFGLSKVLFSPLIVHLLEYTTVSVTLFTMSAIGSILMYISVVLIKKPEYNEGNEHHLDEHFNVIEFIMTNATFKKIWVVFFLNITCGLAIISFEKNLCLEFGLMIPIAIVSMLSALFNTIGRIGFATWSDYLKDKTFTYMTFLTLCVVMCLLVFNWTVGVTVLLLILTVNLGYGAGFSSLPPLIVDLYDVKRLSVIHGLALSAWGVAGLCGNSLSNIVVNRLGMGYSWLFIIILVLYLFALGIATMIGKEK